MQPLHIIHIAGTANGAAWMHQMLVGLRARGHRCTAIIGGSGGSLEQRLIADGIPYHVLDLDIFASRRPIPAAVKLFRLVRLLRQLRPDVVHYHLFQSIIAGRLAAWLADVPARFSMIPGPYQLEAPVLGEVDIATAWTDSKVIASCEYTRTLYAKAGVPREHVELVYYGQDAALFEPERADGARVRRELGIAPDRPVVGDVAYFYPPLPDSPFTPPHLVNRGVKGHEVLLRAVPKVLERVPDALFVLVGKGWGPDGPAYVARLKKMARTLGVADAVLFPGERSDIPDVLTAFDVSVQCSLNENLGGSIESLMMARPLVASAVGGLVDAVIHEQTGLLVPPDDADALAEAISRLLLDRPLADRLARAGRAHAMERLTLDRAVSELDVLYRSELHRAAERSAADRAGYRLTRTAARAVRLAGWIHTIVFPVLKTGRRGWRRRISGGGGLRVVQMAGGTENASWLVHICRRLMDEGHQVSAIIGWPEGSLSRELTAAGVPHACVDLSFAPDSGRARLLVYVVRLPITVLRLARQFRGLRVAVVHTHIFNTIVIGRLAAWIARVPIRVSMVPGPLHLETPFSRTVDRLTWWMDHRVIAGSEATAALYRGLGLKEPRLTCIPYGSDAERFDPAHADGDRVRREFGLAPGTPVIGLVAYFYPPRTDLQTPPHVRGRGVKGHEDFIAAMHLVRRELPDARFLLVGAGWRRAGEAYRQRLIEQCRAEGLGDAAIFTGYRDDIPDLLAAMDVAVQCSLSENYGGTIEALLMERPVVATRIGGMPEVVRDGVTGLLVPPADPAALAAAIGRLVKQPDLARQLARDGRAAVLERNSIDRTADGILALYRELRREPPQAAVGAPHRAA